MIILVLMLFFVVIGVFNLVLLFNLQGNNPVTGFVATSGAIQLFVEADIEILIESPENKTYTFELSDGDYNSDDGYYYYYLDLNVSSDQDVEEWKYSVYNDNRLVDYKVDFNSNTNVAFRLGGNLLTVYAKGVSGKWYDESVVFTIKLDKSAPILEIESEYYGCEGEKFNVNFNVSDYDEDLSVIDVIPRNFLFGKVLSAAYSPIFFAEIYSSGVLGKDKIGDHKKTVYAIDNTNLIDAEDVVFHILEVNEKPIVEDMDVYKIWKKGANITFEKSWNVFDLEDGNAFDGNLYFDLRFFDDSQFGLFYISDNGRMSYEASDISPEGSYLLKACVEDRILTGLHEDLMSICGSNGSSNTVCDEFAFTISSENRIPEFLEIKPNESEIIMIGEEMSFFNASILDYDGDALSIKWFVDGIEKQSDILLNINNSLSYNYFDKFNYTFECGVGGTHNASIFVYDGINNISFDWNISLTKVDCPVFDKEKPSGGGGGGMIYCLENWACLDWSKCQSVDISFETGTLGLDDYYSYKDKCNQIGFLNGSCGYHLRECVDTNNCSNLIYKIPKDDEIEICQFILHPSCRDGIKNCHDGFCEIGIDCGGICGECPTCSDGKKNQEEEGIDCGGPCPDRCFLENPNAVNWMIVLLFSILLVILIFIIYMFIIFGKRRKKEGQEDRTTRLRNVMGER